MNQRSSKVRIYAKLPSKTNLAFVGAVTSDDYKLIRNRIVGHGEGGLKYLVSTLLQKAGWDPKRDERNIFAPVTEIFMQIPDVNLKRFASFVQKKETENFFSDYLKAHKVFNLYDMFKDGLNSIYPDEALAKLVDELWSVSTCVNQTGVGPGEICLSILTNAQKGATGDLLIPNIGDVEVKSSYGRLGSGDNALLLPTRIQDLFAAKNLSIARVRKMREMLDGKEKQYKKATWSWNEAVQTFFLYDWKFSENIVIAALTYLSTQKLNTHNHGRLVAALKKLSPKVIQKLQNHDREELIKIVLTIQLCTYQSDQQFPYLLSVNRKTKDAYPIHFGSSIEKNVLSVYDQITQVNRFSSNLAIDSEGTRKGVEINFI